MYAAAMRDPEVLRAYASIASLISTPKEALAEPGLLGKVIALGANMSRYPTPGPRRAELLAAIGNGGPSHPGQCVRQAPCLLEGGVQQSSELPPRGGAPDAPATSRV